MEVSLPHRTPSVSQSCKNQIPGTPNRSSLFLGSIEALISLPCMGQAFAKESLGNTQNTIISPGAKEPKTQTQRLGCIFRLEKGIFFLLMNSQQPKRQR